MTTTTAISLADITPELAADRIMAFAREGRLVQGQWHGKGAEGREIACLLGSIHPDITGESSCPAGLMPRWMAYLTVRLFDGVPDDTVAHYGEAYAVRMHRWGALDVAGWHRLRKTFVTEIMTAAIKCAEDLSKGHDSPLLTEIRALTDELLAMRLAGVAGWSAYYALRDRARKLRARAGTELTSARTRVAEAEAAAAATAEAATEAETEAEATVAVAAASASAAWALEAATVAEATVAEAEATVEAAVAAEAAAAAEAATAEAATVTEAEAAAAVAAEAAMWAAEAATARALEAETEAEAARRASYARSFDTLLNVIDAELAA